MSECLVQWSCSFHRLSDATELLVVTVRTSFWQSRQFTEMAKLIDFLNPTGMGTVLTIPQPQASSCAWVLVAETDLSCQHRNTFMLLSKIPVLKGARNLVSRVIVVASTLSRVILNMTGPYL